MFAARETPANASIVEFNQMISTTKQREEEIEANLTVFPGFCGAAILRPICVKLACRLTEELLEWLYSTYRY